MRRAFAVLAIMLLVVAGSASASASVAAQAAADAERGQGFFNVGLPLPVTGDVTADASAGFVNVTGVGETFRLSLDAPFVEVERHAWNGTRVTNPVAPESEWFSRYEPQPEESDAFTHATIQALAARDALTLFAFTPALAHGAHVSATGVPGSAVTLDGAAERVVGTSEDEPDLAVGARETGWLLHHQIDTPHLEVLLVPDAVRVTGNFTLHVWEMDFLVEPASGESRTYRTGFHDVSGTGPVKETEIAYARVHVTEGVLEITGAGAAQLLAPRVALDVIGAGELPAAVGGFRAGNAKYEATGETVRFSGALRLDARLVDARPDRALVDFAGALSDVSLTALPASDAGLGVLSTPAGRAAATGTGLVMLLAGAAVLAGGERRAAARRFLRSRPRVRPLRGRALSRVERVEDAVSALADGDDARAVKLLAPLVAESPDDVVLLVDYGCALERLGRTRDARDAFESAVQEDPGNAEAHYYYSRVLARLNLTASALPHLQRAIALDARLAEMAARDAGFRNVADHPSFMALTS